MNGGVYPPRPPPSPPRDTTPKCLTAFLEVVCSAIGPGQSEHRPGGLRVRDGRDPADRLKLRVHEEAAHRSLLRPHLRF